MSKLVKTCAGGLRDRRYFEIFDDFDWYITAHRWTTVVSDSGTIAHADATAGRITLTPSDGSVTNNDEAYLRSTTECLLHAAGRPIYAETRIQFTEGNTDDVNIMFGMMDAVAANSILDDGGGPQATFSGNVIYKVDGETVYRCASSRSTTRTVTQSTTTAGGSSFQVLGIEVIDLDDTNLQAVFYVNGVLLVDSNNRPIKHTVALASATEMALFVGIKNGADTTAEALVVDYLGAAQLRPVA